MKHLKYIILLIVVALSTFHNTIKAQLTVNNTLVVKTCNLGIYGNATISAPTEALTGDNISLSITFPMTAIGCVKKVTITNSSNLTFVSSSTISLIPAGTNMYTNSTVLDPMNGQTFVAMYKFPNGKICNAAVGNFSVKYEVNCGGTITTCTADVSTIARAANYWTIDKQYINGNLTCGVSQWKIRLNHTNPNGFGLGAYDISGTITETSPLVIAPIGTTAAAGSCYQSYPSEIYVTLQNCQAQGTSITNTANYSLKLGDPLAPCGPLLTGTVSASSPLLASPNASISFTKTAYANGNIFSTGCTGMYVIAVCNNGNVPWTGFTITDNLPSTGITVTGYSATGWSIGPTPTTYTGTVTFSNPTLTLAAGACAYVYIYFNITGPTSSTVTNNATLNYHASIPGGGGTSGSCLGIICPTITTEIKNISTTNTFTITAPQAIPSIAKCNDPSWAVPIKSVGGTIKFRIQVANGGAAPLTTTVTDALVTPQNLTLVPGSITYTYYTNQNYNYCGSVSGTGVSGNIYVPSGNTGTSTNLIFNVVSLPGNCNLWKNNILVIEFDATINPQLSGSKTNTTVMGIQSAAANYTIDKYGELKIRKVADVATVENGSNFNYIITVSNPGSTPLNNIIVTDNLPACVQYVGPVLIKKVTTSSTTVITAAGALVGSTITVPPLAFINPGESFTLTIPVKKLSGTNCCNPLATATAKLVPDAIQINATTPVDAPACVTSLTCCDIQNFTATLNPSYPSGTFNLFVNAGPTPVQELEVSMLDYHVTYSNADCKPANMGIFGNLFSPTTTIGGLYIANNNTHSVNWALGSPSVVNGNIKITINKPAISLLDCCNGQMYFCLKVRVKNIKCQVCEKIVCGKFNLKSNKIDWEPNPSDVLVDKQDLKIASNLVEVNEKFVAKLKQVDEIESTQIQTLIELHLKNLEPSKAQEFLNKLAKDPQKTITEIQASIKGGPLLSAPTGGTTAVPNKPR